MYYLPIHYHCMCYEYKNNKDTIQKYSVNILPGCLQMMYTHVYHKMQKKKNNNLFKIACLNGSFDIDREYSMFEYYKCGGITFLLFNYY